MLLEIALPELQHETKRVHSISKSELENSLALQNFSFRFIVWEMLLHTGLVYELTFRRLTSTIVDVPHR